MVSNIYALIELELILSREKTNYKIIGVKKDHKNYVV